MTDTMTSDELIRPIIGIENRTPQEVFDIMADRFRARLSADKARMEELREALGKIAKRIETAAGGGTVNIDRPPLGWPMTQSASQSSLLLSILETSRAALQNASTTP